MLTRPAATANIGKTHAAKLVRRAFEHALQTTPKARVFADQLLDTCAVRLWDLVDSVGLQEVSALASLGWRKKGPGVWASPNRILPDVVERDRPYIAFRVANLEHLLSIIGLETPIEGQESGPFRRARVFADGDASFDAVERNGSDTHEAIYVPERRLRRAHIHQQLFRTRRREFRSADKGMKETRRLITSAVADLGAPWAADLFLRAEREHWAQWCTAGLLQFRRQQRAGIGWCNIDHHTYLASREQSHEAIEMFADLGFRPGETLRVDSWGSQVLTHSILRTAVTVDLDLGANEELLAGPRPMPPLLWHGCAGLWVDLHGEGLLDGGPHHIGCLLERSAFARGAHADGVSLQHPSSDRSEFFQQMTGAEERAVNPRRIDKLQHHELLTARQAEHFRIHGGLATHLECIERNEGFSGYDTPTSAPVALS